MITQGFDLGGGGGNHFFYPIAHRIKFLQTPTTRVMRKVDIMPTTHRIEFSKKHGGGYCTLKIMENIHKSIFFICINKPLFCFINIKVTQMNVCIIAQRVADFELLYIESIYLFRLTKCCTPQKTATDYIPLRPDSQNWSSNTAPHPRSTKRKNLASSDENCRELYRNKNVYRWADKTPRGLT